jgi:hypothetical protein
MNATRFPDLPNKMRSLPVDHRGFPVPWFVAWVDGEPQFPIADGRKFAVALNQRRCWVCGHELGRLEAFVIGPMCVVNRTTGEPPCHLECARFSARNCPFLTKPRMKRVGEENLPCGVVDGAGIAIKRNPGCAAVWIVKPRTWRLFSDGQGGQLINIGEGPPHAVEWYALGREATRAEVMDSVESGLPLLQQYVDSDEAAAELARRIIVTKELLPA